MTHAALPGPASPRPSLRPDRRGRIRLARLCVLGGLGMLGGLACTGQIGGERAPSPAAPGARDPGASAPDPQRDPQKPPVTGMPTPPTTPGPTDPPPAATCQAAPRRIWPLTPDQLARTIATVLPAPADFAQSLKSALAVANGFSNEAGRLVMTEPYVSQLIESVWPLAGAAAANPGKLAPCLAQATLAPTCVRDFVTGFGARAFRRDLAPAEVDAFVVFHASQLKVGDAAFALRELLVQMLLSPSLLYRTELGADGAQGASVALTSFEKASALSYFLTDGPPDADLMAAAKANALDNKAAIEAHTRRLLAHAEGASGWLKFFRETFLSDDVRAVTKDPMRFADWKADLAADLAGEQEAFTRQVLWAEGGKLQTLLTADFSMLNSRLATFYGVADPALGAAFTKVKHRPGERAGLLTTAGSMATLAKENDTDPVGRGKFVREVLLCHPIPPPPSTVNAVPPPPDGKRTQRERMAVHSADASCSACHSLMDPLGLAFERYDGIGRYRTTDVGKTLDVAGHLTEAEPADAPFADAVELMRVLARSPDVASCFVGTALRYANGREAGGYDACTLDRLGQRFVATGGDMMDLAVSITTDESFFLRAGNL
jgi:hypothetical protein